MSVQQTSLYYRDGGSDKVYHAQIEKADGGFVVNFQYGRRGSTLQTGTKTATPVDEDKAQKVYLKLIAEKTAKGYTPGEDGTPYAGTEKAGLVSGQVPQLLNPIDEDTVNRLIEDDDWFMQEKFDGVRLMNQNAGGVITGSNRNGLIVPISAAIESRLKEPPCQNFIVDGEAIGDTYYMFDLLMADGLNYNDSGALARWFQLLGLFGNYSKDYSAIRVVPSFVTTTEKRAAFEQLKARNAEGVVFKRKASTYVPGRPNSGGNQLKFKFVQSCTCFVRSINDGKRSVVLGMENGKELVGVGNVTILPNFGIPNEGDLIEVRYLYAYPGGSLYQPVYLGSREGELDKADDISTLKFKQGTTDEEEN
jgi:bifunctional non-homologous end joining protein LigD